MQRLIQITDLHFRQRPGDILTSGIVTDHSLCRVLDRLSERESSSTPVLVTGDLVHDPVVAAYRRLRKTLERYPFTFYCLPGNHDDPAMMHDHLATANVITAAAAKMGGWTLLMLDSTVAQMPFGRLGPERMTRLREHLDGVREGHVLLALHHHPVAVRSPWMDRMALADSADLFAAVRDSGRVRAVLFGHVHQEVDREHAGARLLGTPSTCVQFAPHTLTMSLDGKAPAYRWVELYPDGFLETGVVYLEAEALRVSA